MKINEIITEASKGSLADQLAPVQQQRMSDYERDFKANNMTPAQKAEIDRQERMKAVTTVEPDENGLLAPVLSKRKSNLEAAIRMIKAIDFIMPLAQSRDNIDTTNIYTTRNNIISTQQDKGHEDDYVGLKELLENLYEKLDILIKKSGFKTGVKRYLKKKK